MEKKPLFDRLKEKMTLKRTQVLFIVLMLVAILIMTIASGLDSGASLAAGIVVTMLDLAMYIAFWRCPHCGRFLGRDVGDYCTHCGKKLDR